MQLQYNSQTLLNKRNWKVWWELIRLDAITMKLYIAMVLYFRFQLIPTVTSTELVDFAFDRCYDQVTYADYCCIL